MSGTRSDVKAFNHDQGDDAAVVGPSRSRIRQILVFGNSAGHANRWWCTGKSTRR